MDPARLGDWVTIHREVDHVADSQLKEGSTLRQELCLRHVRFHVRWTVAEVQAPRARRGGMARGRRGAKAHSVGYRLSPNGDGGTSFDYENEFKAPLGAARQCGQPRAGRGGATARGRQVAEARSRRLRRAAVASAASAPSTSSRTICAAGSTSCTRRDGLARERDVLVGAVVAQRGQQLGPGGGGVDGLRVLAEPVDQRRAQRARVRRPAGPVVGRQHALGVPGP